MFRLNQRAFELLKAEAQKITGNDVADQVLRDIALRRWEKLRTQVGSPLSAAELRETVNDVFPDFSEKVLQAAARANQPSVIAGKLKFASIFVAGTAGLAGMIWVLNLPYPMIRWPVARTMPIILLPSFMSMDSNYRQAIAAIEQADQLVNQATSAADLELGATRVKAAQKNLNALPVWFVGYYPQSYCGLFQCGWRFTQDEFMEARKNIARMDAKLFQERNAQVMLTQAEEALGSAIQLYQEAPNRAEQDAAIAQWQQAIDQLHQIPPQTLAGRMVKVKLVAYERDFRKVNQ